MGAFDSEEELRGTQEHPCSAPAYVLSYLTLSIFGRGLIFNIRRGPVVAVLGLLPTCSADRSRLGDEHQSGSSKDNRILGVGLGLDNTGANVDLTIGSWGQMGGIQADWSTNREKEAQRRPRGDRVLEIMRLGMVGS